MSLRFVPTAIGGLVRIETKLPDDLTGQVMPLWCPREFATGGLGWFQPTQVSLLRHPERHTLRGLHCYAAPYAAASLLRVVRGRTQAAVIDLRADSETFSAWLVVELDTVAMTGLFVPAGCASGYLTLEADTDVLSQTDGGWVPERQFRGIRWNDPAFAVAWDAEPAVIDGRDATWPDWDAAPVNWVHTNRSSGRSLAMAGTSRAARR